MNVVVAGKLFWDPVIVNKAQQRRQIALWGSRMDFWDPMRLAEATEHSMQQRQQATLRIREMILRGDLGPGQRIAEAAIAAQLGISRTPVRQALPALAEEGLLAPSGRRGYAVRVFTINEVITALDIRATLEGMAARLLTERGVSHVLLHALKACLAEGDALFAKRSLAGGDELRYGQVNEKFHKAIIEAADNNIISELVAKLYRVPFVTPAVIAFDKKSRIEIFDLLYHAHRQHHAITNALENGQGARAEALLKEHVFAQKQSMNLTQHRPGMQHSTLAELAVTRI
jgi:GntR family transcriptional regulator, vanillate catabolism transcriptional regulator